MDSGTSRKMPCCFNTCKALSTLCKRRTGSNLTCSATLLKYTCSVSVSPSSKRNVSTAEKTALLSASPDWFLRCSFHNNSKNITVGDGTVIGGNVTVKKPGNWGMSWGKPKIPRVVLGPNSTVKGNLVFEREVELYVHSTAKYGKIVYLEAEAGKAEALKPIVFTGKEPDFK